MAVPLAATIFSMVPAKSAGFVTGRRTGVSHEAFRLAVTVAINKIILFGAGERVGNFGG